MPPDDAPKSKDVEANSDHSDDGNDVTAGDVSNRWRHAVASGDVARVRYLLDNETIDINSIIQVSGAFGNVVRRSS